jgi:hypothetical protein
VHNFHDLNITEFLNASIKAHKSQKLMKNAARNKISDEWLYGNVGLFFISHRQQLYTALIILETLKV